MSAREAMEMALDALNLPSLKTQEMLRQRDETIATLRAALAEEALQRLTDVQQEIEAVLEQPDRKPLTDGELYTAYIAATNQTLRPQEKKLAFAFARAIEAAHGIGEKL